MDYQAELRRHSIRISMSGKGNCYDNAMVETFFKTIFLYVLWSTVFYTRAQAEQAIARYMTASTTRSGATPALDYISPVQFERTVSR